MISASSPRSATRRRHVRRPDRRGWRRRLDLLARRAIPTPGPACSRSRRSPTTRKRLDQIPGSVPPPGTIRAGCPFRAALPAAGSTAAPSRCRRSHRRSPAHRAPAGSPPRRRRRDECRCMRHPRASARPSPTRRAARPAAAAGRARGRRRELPGRARRGAGAWSAKSGCGKSTLGRLLLRLDRADRRQRELRGPGHERAVAPRDARQMRRQMQIVFQDPFGSLSARGSRSPTSSPSRWTASA